MALQFFDVNGELVKTGARTVKCVTGYNLAGRSVKLTATISSIILMGDSLGGMILPSLTGQVVEHFGAPMMTWLVFGSLACNALALGAILRLRGSGAQIQGKSKLEQAEQ